MTVAHRTRWAASVAFAGAVAFVVLGVLVATGATRSLDVAAREAFRPDGVWGDTQLRADVVVEGMRPVVVLAVLVAAGAAMSLVRMSPRPLGFALALGLVAGVPALAVKRALARTDPYGNLSSIGSFPSGHVMFVTVCLGGLLLMVRPRTVWWQWAGVASGAALMAVCMLLQAAHWLTDVVGGFLLGVIALATTATACWLLPGAAPPHHGDPPVPPQAS